MYSGKFGERSGNLFFIFLVFTGDDYNRPYNYKIAKFTVFVRGGGKGAVVVLGFVLRLSFKHSEEKQGERVIKIEQMRTSGEVEGGGGGGAFHQIFDLVEIWSKFCLYFHGGLEFFLQNFATLIQVPIEKS